MRCCFCAAAAADAAAAATADATPSSAAALVPAGRPDGVICVGFIVPANDKLSHEGDTAALLFVTATPRDEVRRGTARLSPKRRL